MSIGRCIMLGTRRKSFHSLSSLCMLRIIFMVEEYLSSILNQSSSFTYFLQEQRFASLADQSMVPEAASESKKKDMLLLLRSSFSLPHEELLESVLLSELLFH